MSELRRSISACGIGRNEATKFNNFGVTVLLLAHSRKFILLCDVQGTLLSYIMTCRRKVVIEKNSSNNVINARNYFPGVSLCLRYMQYEGKYILRLNLTWCENKGTVFAINVCLQE
jgi:hypothetical protein